MGNFANFAAESGGLANPDAGQNASKTPVRDVVLGAPVSAGIWRNGQLIPFTLDVTCQAPEASRLWPEQILIAVVLVVSFVVPVFHLLG